MIRPTEEPSFEGAVAKPPARTLVMGCDGGDFVFNLYKHGVASATQIVSIDISETSVATTEQYYEGRLPEHFTWNCMDALCMDYAHGQFDLVCDLSLLDYCYLSEDADSKVRQLLGEVHRVLAIDGQALFLTIRAPEEVCEFLGQEDNGDDPWKVDFMHLQAKCNDEGVVEPGERFHTVGSGVLEGSLEVELSMPV